MNRTIPVAACFAVMVAAFIAGPANADEASPLSADWTGWIDGSGREASGDPWTFGPVIGIHASGDGRFGAGLGFRSAAKVDSRFGAIYSRLSLAFERTLRTDRFQTAIGYSVGRGLGDYAHRSEIDVMKLDADFAMQMSPAVTGFVDYGAEMDLGSGAEHQIVLRFKFDF